MATSGAHERRAGARAAYLMRVAECPTHRFPNRVGDRRANRPTPLGESLVPVTAVLTEWAERHIDDIDTACATYDSATPS
jgi:hypothetical protein